MKRVRIFRLACLIPCLFALNGCFFKQNKENETIIQDTKIILPSSLKINLYKESTKSINPELSTNIIKNPAFSFSSSNTGVATVSEQGVVTGISVGTTTITVTLVQNTSIKASVKVNVINKEVDTYDYTIMFYMSGSDLEYSSKLSASEQGFFTEDIIELLSVKNIPDSVKIILQTGGTKGWHMPGSYLEGATKISSTNLQRWEVNNETNKLKLIDTLDTNYMAKESSFSEFLSWGLDDYEADQMGVVISGHGGGIAGCAFDDNYLDKYGYGRTLRTFEVANATKTALQNSDKEKFTWIGYDCCLMQCADIASINADYFEYMVASQEEELASGWNHDEYLPYLKSNTKISPEEFLPKICDSFVSQFHKYDSSEFTCYQTLSVLDLSKAETFVSAFNTMTHNLGSKSAAYTKMLNAFKSSYREFGGAIFGLCDMSSILNNLKTSVSVSAVKSALDDLVIYKKNCSNYAVDPCGLNAFFPYENDSKNMLQVGKEDYSDPLSTKLSDWQEICLTYGTFGW